MILIWNSPALNASAFFHSLARGIFSQTERRRRTIEGETNWWERIRISLYPRQNFLTFYRMRLTVDAYYQKAVCCECCFVLLTRDRGRLETRPPVALGSGPTTRFVLGLITPFAEYFPRLDTHTCARTYTHDFVLISLCTHPAIAILESQRLVFVVQVFQFCRN